MTGLIWDEEEVKTLKWFAKRREEHLEALEKGNVRDRMGERLWTWDDIADKMQKVASRDGWECKRKYESSTCCLAWRMIQDEAEVKLQIKEESKIESPSHFEPVHGTGETVDALPLGPATFVEAIPAPDIPSTPAQVLSDDPAKSTSRQNDTVDVKFDASANTITVNPKQTSPAADRFPETKLNVKAEGSAELPCGSFSINQSAWSSTLKLDSNSAPSLNTSGEPHSPDTRGSSSSPARSIQHGTTTRLNARWEDHEVEALDWFIGKRDQETKILRPGVRARNWTWEAIAGKMNRVAHRDGWERTRIYTAANCYGAWSTKSTRIPTSRPSVARRHQTLPGFAVRHGQGVSSIGATVGAAISDTINGPPPPGPDIGVEPAPYHWTRAEREALHEVYVFSRIAENKLLSRGECRKRGNWTWGMVAREMNQRSITAPWSVGRVYDQSNCYNMIKYEKDNFNLQGNLQPLESDSEDKDEDENNDHVMF